MTPISHVSIVIWLMLGSGPAQDRLTVQVSWEHELDEAAVAAVLSNGKLVVIDRSEPSIYLVDGDLTSDRKIGRLGSGPGEYRDPSAVFAFRGDSAMVWDRQLRRFLVIAPEGDVGRELIPPPHVPRGRPVGVDSLGRVAFLIRGPYDQTTWLTMWNSQAPSSRVDTVGQVRLPPQMTVTRRRAGLRSAARQGLEGRQRWQRTAAAR